MCIHIVYRNPDAISTMSLGSFQNSARLLWTISCTVCQAIPAIFNCSSGIFVFLLQQCPSPVDVVTIQPVVVDAEGVLLIQHCVVPPTRYKNGLPSFLNTPTIKVWRMVDCDHGA